MDSNGKKANGVRSRQLILFGLVSLLILAVAGVAAYVYSRDAGSKTVTGKEAKIESRPIVTGGAAYSDKEAWMTQSATEQTATRKRLKELEVQLAQMTERSKNEVDRLTASGRLAASQPKPVDIGPPPSSIFAPPVLPTSVEPPPARPKPTFPILSAPPPPVPATPAVPPAAPRGAIGSVEFDAEAPKPTGAGPTAKPQSLRSGNAVSGTDSISLSRKRDEEGAESGGLGEQRQAGSFIPSGTFARIVVLNGLDAPTGGQAQSNPAPVLLRVLDAANLPNGYKADLAGCIVTANGYGDVSAERAYIRIDRLTCVNESGGAIDIPVKGYIAGEDGKAGMRGRLVTKTGQILANGLLAGIGSGIGQAFQSSAVTTTISPFGGAAETVEPGKAAQAGVAGGVGKAFDVLSKYYVSLAEKTFPIIEVDGGRVADLVISRGFTIERK
jgi:conjugal transfer pilus assembly protein TraB